MNTNFIVIVILPLVFYLMMKSFLNIEFESQSYEKHKLNGKNFKIMKELSFHCNLMRNS